MNFYLIQESFKDTFNKYKKEFKTVFLNLKDSIQDNKELKEIFLKYYNKEEITKEDNLILKEVLKNDLKVVGLSGLSILSLPLPGSTFLIMFIIKGAEKLGINLLPNRERIEQFIDEKDNLLDIEILESVDTNFDQLIDISKYTQYDWNILQKQVIKDCFDNIIDDKFLNYLSRVSMNNINSFELDILSVKLTKSKKFAAICTTKIDNNNELVDPHYKFNVNIKWDKKKLQNVMAHEMIHYLFLKLKLFKVGHNHDFQIVMNKINKLDNEYKVTLKDDLFIIKDDLSNELGLYFYIFTKNNSNRFLFSSSNKDFDSFIKNNPDFLRWNMYYKYDEVTMYKITKGTETKYGLPNKRKFGVYSFRNDILDDILKNSEMIDNFFINE